MAMCPNTHFSSQVVFGKYLVSSPFFLMEQFNDVDSGHFSINGFLLTPLHPWNIQHDHFAEDDSGYDAESLLSSTGLVVEWDEDDFADQAPLVADEEELFPAHNDDPMEYDPMDDVPLDQLLHHLPEFEDNQARFDFWAERGFFNGPLQPEIDVNAVDEEELQEDIIPIARDPVAQAMVIAGMGDLVWWIPQQAPAEPMEVEF